MENSLIMLYKGIIIKKTSSDPKRFFVSGWKMGLEPTTFGTTIRRSNQLSYIHRVCPDLPSEQRANLIHFSIIAKFYPTFSFKIYAGLEIGDRFVPRYQ